MLHINFILSFIFYSVDKLKIMKNILLIALAILYTMSVSAQIKESKTIVQTEQGSLYKGKVINGNIFEIKMLLDSGDTYYCVQR